MSPILPKNEPKNFNFCHSLVGQNFFGSFFLEELKIPQFPFEINRLLVLPKIPQIRHNLFVRSAQIGQNIWDIIKKKPYRASIARGLVVTKKDRSRRMKTQDYKS